MQCVIVLQVRSIISSFGTLKAFSLLRDASGTPTGTALAEFVDPGVINPAIAGEACADSVWDARQHTPEVEVHYTLLLWMLSFYCV